MTLEHIALFTAFSFPFMWLVPGRWRAWGLLLLSVLAVAWLMGDGLLAPLSFTLFVGTVLLVIVVWWVVQPESADDARRQENRLALGLIIVLVGVLAAVNLILNDALSVSLAVAGVGGIGLSVATVPRAIPSLDSSERLRLHKQLALVAIVAIIGILAIIKIPSIGAMLGLVLESDVVRLDAASVLVWLGFSYLAFRLLAILLDFRAGRLPKDGISLRDMAVYVLFFPAFTAGPIDRANRFITDLADAKPLDAARLTSGLGRIVVGVFKKFIIADALALVAMSSTTISHTDGTVGLWVLLYLYAFHIYFDFSGYSDVAIGLGRLYGISLPENFDRPYVQRNIQQFWQRWHITLSTWFRVYFFTPLSRTLIRSRYKLPQWTIVLVCQLATMILIGLWHGVSLNFLLWGLWHGVGLFIHKQLADNTRGWFRRVSARVWSDRMMGALSVFVTFHFVALGWVFFALQDTNTSVETLLRLVGLGG